LYFDYFVAPQVKNDLLESISVTKKLRTSKRTIEAVNHITYHIIFHKILQAEK